eukprot:TRINITY_DN6010_c0_g1_i1.p1 TRINITY_DN6010_c0_g1~~TRINITY_DN6010_c0_g1_i1.p1  ORF type:complete len:340 (-),score=52.11 TRINITY_DN6010_c0_g1_i1:196-1215(-)
MQPMSRTSTTLHRMGAIVILIACLSSVTASNEATGWNGLPQGFAGSYYQAAYALADDASLLISVTGNLVQAYNVSQPASPNLYVTTSLPTSFYFAAAAVSNGVVWVCGGFHTSTNWGSGDTDCAYVDLQSGQFDQASSLNYGRAYLSAAVQDNWLYMIGGCTMALGRKCQEQNYVEFLNLRTPYNWQNAPSLSDARYGAAVAVYGEVVYVAGGYARDTPLSSVEFLLPGAAKWQYMNPIQPRGHLALIAVSDQLFAIGGATCQTELVQFQCSEVTSAAQVYPISDSGPDVSGAWTYDATRTLSLAYTGYGAINGSMYVFGGIADSGLDRNGWVWVSSTV